MTNVLITIDTELSCGLHQRGIEPRENLDRSIHGKCADGAFGVGWQMDQLEIHGLKGVFFVDPMPAKVYGNWVIMEIVEPILARGHDVQLHIHTEWLEWMASSPVGDRRGQNIGDFSFDDQIALVRSGLQLLEGSGAPTPIAFRAGNFGADDNTLRALRVLGMSYDSSFNAFYADGVSRIGLDRMHFGPVRRHGVIEIPVSDICDGPGRVRPAQICAMSAWEMSEALSHADANGHPAFVIVSHSFEMLSRDRKRANRSVMDRFQRMCRQIAETKNLRAVGFSDLDPDVVVLTGSRLDRLASNAIRTGVRRIKQAIDTVIYERKLGRVR